jgi:hypothetical protein
MAVVQVVHLLVLVVLAEPILVAGVVVAVAMAVQHLAAVPGVQV